MRIISLPPFQLPSRRRVRGTPAASRRPKAERKSSQHSPERGGAIFFHAYCTEAIEAHFDGVLARLGAPPAEEEVAG